MRALPAVPLFLLLLAATGGCAHNPISEQLRQEAKKDNLTFAAVSANPGTFQGRTVLWGGKIISLTALPQGSELLVLQTDLDSLGRPRGVSASKGQFIALTRNPLNPEFYKSGADVVLAGEVIGAVEANAGPAGQALPSVRVKELYIWDDYYYRDSSVYYWIDVH